MKLFIETFGCQMNFSDSEIIASILSCEGYSVCRQAIEADLILINTCAVRDHAEQRVRKRLKELAGLKRRRPSIMIGVVGCMAERMKEQLLEEEPVVDLLAGPDSYRDLPLLLYQVSSGHRAANVVLSDDENYDDLVPVRYNSGGVTAFISIMRGCGNYCSYCVVPYTRGKERSRDPVTVLKECSILVDSGYKEVTLLGQNVNSYRFVTEPGTNKITDFPGLLAKVAGSFPGLRIRFATSHPKDLSDSLIDVMASFPNICSHFHLPAQSGNNRILKLMNRKYTREWYIERAQKLRSDIPGISISTDLIAGFCTEKEDEHQDTLSLMSECRFDFAFMFAYSERPGTDAATTLPDDVPLIIKKRRLNEIITLQRELSHQSNLSDIGKTFEVLVEGVSKKSEHELFGRTSSNKVLVFPSSNHSPGDKVMAEVIDCTTATLLGKISALHGK